MRACGVCLALGFQAGIHQLRHASHSFFLVVVCLGCSAKRQRLSADIHLRSDKALNFFVDQFVGGGAWLL